MKLDMLSYTTDYTSRKYPPGTSIVTKNYGTAIILGKSTKYTKKFVLKFELTGHEKVVHMSQLPTREILDPLYPSIFSTGFMGVGQYSKVKNPREYDTWRNMILRCYANDPRYLNYKDVSVALRWHDFQNFCEDLPTLPGYLEWSKTSGYSLDKDILDPTAKVYSKTTCQFVTIGDNARDAVARRMENANAVKTS